MNNLITEIKKKKATCIFVSPHFDDAIFSAGGLIYALHKHNIKVHIVTVFTKAGKENTLSAKAYLKQCGYPNGVDLYKKRKEEDLKAIEGLAQPLHLGLTEALWRKRITKNIFKKYIPELSTIYPTYRWHITKGMLSTFDTGAMNTLKKKLLLLTKGKKNVWVFAPVGVGNHVDHIFVREVCKKLDLPVVYWNDYPYSKTNAVNKVFVKKNKLKEYTFTNYKKQKEHRMNMYKTQLHVFHPILNKKELEEKYFTHI